MDLAPPQQGECSSKTAVGYKPSCLGRAQQGEKNKPRNKGSRLHVFKSHKEITGSEADFSLAPTGRRRAPGSPVPFDSGRRLARFLTRLSERSAESFHALDWKQRACGNHEINFQPWGLPRRPSFSPESASAKEIGGAEPSARPWPREEARGFGNQLLLPSNTQEPQDPRSPNPRMWCVCVCVCARV